MAMTENCLQYAFDTRITALATATTLASATRHDFAAITLHIPENTSRTFLSIKLVVTVRDAFTVATDFDGFRLGIKLGAVAFDDLDVTNAQVNTADHERLVLVRDVTSYFNSNFGSGTSQTCQVGVAFATGAASNVNGITAKLIIAYEFDDAAQTTRAKTVFFPIQSHHTILGTSHTEVGTTGGAAGTDAAANQIPALDTYLPEASKTYRQAFLEIQSNELSGNGTTDITPYYQIDSTTEVARAPCEQALGASTYFHDIYIFDTATHSPASAHAFKARSDVASRLMWLGGWLAVTYEYSTSGTTTVMNQVILPIRQVDGASTWLNGDGTAANANLFRVEHDVQEPGTIAIKQSAIVAMTTTVAISNVIITAGSQNERTYTFTSNAPYVGPTPFIHRVDHNSGWTLARGKNTLKFRARQSAEGRHALHGWVLLSYTSGVFAGSGGVSNHARTVSFHLAGVSDTAAFARDIAAANVRHPKINATAYSLVAVLAELHIRNAASIGFASLWGEQQSGEWDAAGWLVRNVMPSTATDIGTLFFGPDLTSWFNANSAASGKANIETARDWRIDAAVAAVSNAILHATYHTITYALAGTLSGYTGDGSGISVDVYRVDTKEKVATVTSAIGGGFSATVFDDTTNYFCIARQDATHVGRSDDLAANGAFAIDLSIGGGGGGSDTASGGRFNRGFN